MGEDDDLKAFNVEEHRDEVEALADDLETHTTVLFPPHLPQTMKDEAYFTWAAKLYEQGWRKQT